MDSELLWPSARTACEMTALRRMLLGLAFVCANAFALQRVEPAEMPTAESIMTRVAANQDKTEADRVHYIYMQHARVVSRKGKTVMCEEITDSRVAPTASGSDVQLIKLDGRVLQKGNYVAYTSIPTKQDGKTQVETDDDSVSIT